MKVSQMQQIDYWVGVPLCFILSVWYGLLEFLMPRGPRKPKRILFIELSEMGSAILAHSSLDRARQMHGAELYFMIFDKNRESVSLTGVIPEENIISIDDRNFSTFCSSMARAMWRVRSLGIDTVIDMELFSRCTALLTILSGATNRVGYHRHTNEGLYRGNFLTHRVLYNPHQHMSLNFLSLIMALENDNRDDPMLKINVASELREIPQLQTSEAERQAAWEILKKADPAITPETRIVLLNPDPGVLPLRGWPLEKFEELAARLVTDFPDIKLAVIGLPRSKSFADAIIRKVGAERCLDLTGMTSCVREVVVLFAFARLLITNDSGPAHLASLSAIKSVVLFGPETPRLYGPLGPNVTNIYAALACSPCYAASNHRRTVCTNNRCMQVITVDEVYSAANRYLAA
jgi:ADP-heptose:LPS heptosyltransferase